MIILYFFTTRNVANLVFGYSDDDFVWGNSSVISFMSGKERWVLGFCNDIILPVLLEL